MNSKIKNIIKSKNLTKYQKLSKILKYLFIDVAKIIPTAYFIIGSFALRKHRIISDLDINLNDIEFYKIETLINNGFGNIQFHNKQIRWFYDMTTAYNKLTGQHEKDFSIEAFMNHSSTGFPNNKFSLDYLKKHKGLSKDENGHQFMNLKTLLKWKKTMNRPKDIEDIKMIKHLLKKL